MARVDITVPDDLLARARAAGLDVSRVTSDALADALDRLAKLAELNAYLVELDAELGPPSPEETAEARNWADQLGERSSAARAATTGAA